MKRVSSMLLPPILLLYGAAHFLLPAEGEVVQDFKNCLEFFLDKTPPGESLTPPREAKICQFYKNAYRFATMYDRDKRIPIYSAYKCKPGKGHRYQGWMIEPQPTFISKGARHADRQGNYFEELTLLAIGAFRWDSNTIVIEVKSQFLVYWKVTEQVVTATFSFQPYKWKK